MAAHYPFTGCPSCTKDGSKCRGRISQQGSIKDNSTKGQVHVNWVQVSCVQKLFSKNSAGVSLQAFLMRL